MIMFAGAVPVSHERVVLGVITFQAAGSWRQLEVQGTSLNVIKQLGLNWYGMPTFVMACGATKSVILNAGRWTN